MKENLIFIVIMVGVLVFGIATGALIEGVSCTQEKQEIASVCTDGIKNLATECTRLLLEENECNCGDGTDT